MRDITHINVELKASTSSSATAHYSLYGGLLRYRSISLHWENWVSRHRQSIRIRTPLTCAHKWRKTTYTHTNTKYAPARTPTRTGARTQARIRALARISAHAHLTIKYKNAVCYRKETIFPQKTRRKRNLQPATSYTTHSQFTCLQRRFLAISHYFVDSFHQQCLRMGQNQLQRSSLLRSIRLQSKSFDEDF